MSHHGSNPLDSNDPLNDDKAREAMSKAMRTLLGEYPDGKLNPNDEGALAVMIGQEGKRVVMRFPKPIAWIGFTPEQALDIASTLIMHARQCGLTIPLVLRVGAEQGGKS